MECKEHCNDHSGAAANIAQNKQDIGTIYEILDKVRNRLPNCATLILSIAFLVIGWLIRSKMVK